ncbi:unnamed protein product [Merluccius merluccius]
MEGIENPAFDGGGGSTETFASSQRLGSEIRGDRPDSTLAAHPKNVELRAPARERGMLLARRDEEVSGVKPGAAVLQPLPLLHSGAGAWGPGPSQRDTAAQIQAGATALEAAGPAPELIPCYAQQLRERVRPDMITLGSLSLQQKPPAEGLLEKHKHAHRKEKITSFFGRKVKELHMQRETTQKAPQQSDDAASQWTIENQSQRVLGEGQEEVMVKYEQMTEIPESSSPPPLWQTSKRVHEHGRRQM